MSCNVGKVDRIIRAVLGVILIVAPFLSAGSSISGLLVLIGIILVVTAAIGMCPLYKVLKLDTGCKTNQSA
jgi:hypothetical protein